MRASTIFALVVLAIAGIIIIVSLGYSYEASLFPLLITIPMAALAVAQIIKETRAKAELPQQGEKVSGKGIFGKYLAVPAWMVALLLIIYLIGLLMGFPLFIFLYLKLHHQSWLLSIVMTLVTIAVIYGGFVIGFKIPLWEGLLFM